MGPLQRVRKWCSDYFTQTLSALTATALALFLPDTLKSLRQALSESGMGLMAWWQAETAVANWRLVLLAAASVAVPVALFLFLNRRVKQLTRERDDMRENVRSSEFENMRLSEELNSRNAPDSKPAFEPDRFQAMVLRYFWEVDPDTQLSAKDVSEHTELHPNHAAAILDDLLNEELVLDALTMNRGRVFYLNAEGRKLARRMVEQSEKTIEWPNSEFTPVVDHVQLGATMAAKMTERSDRAVEQLIDRLTPQSIGAQPATFAPSKSSETIKMPRMGSEHFETPSNSELDRVQIFALRIISSAPKGASFSASDVRQRGPFSPTTVKDALDRLTAGGFLKSYPTPNLSQPTTVTIKWQITDKGREALSQKR